MYETTVVFYFLYAKWSPVYTVLVHISLLLIGVKLFAELLVAVMVLVVVKVLTLPSKIPLVNSLDWVQVLEVVAVVNCLLLFNMIILTISPINHNWRHWRLWGNCTSSGINHVRAVNVCTGRNGRGMDSASGAEMQLWHGGVGCSCNSSASQFGALFWKRSVNCLIPFVQCIDMFITFPFGLEKKLKLIDH